MARKARRALFTDSESGKCSTISGSRIATFVPCWSRLAYFPRTVVGLAAVPEVSGCFIEFSLGWSSEPDADDTDNTVCFIMTTNSRRFFVDVPILTKCSSPLEIHSSRFNQRSNIKLPTKITPYHRVTSLRKECSPTDILNRGQRSY